MKRPGDILITLAVTCTAALSCAKESTESIPCSDVPVSFSAFGSWDEATKTAADGSMTIFTAGDRIGVFAYHNDSSTPDFMNDQPVQFDGTSWSYSPIKYWPAAQDDRLSFYAYWPYSEAGRGCISIDGNGGAPTLTYSNPDADIDLMGVAATGITRTGNVSSTVTLNFRHLLAKVKFRFTIVGDQSSYHPVVHLMQYEVPYSEGTLSWEALNSTTEWAEEMPWSNLSSTTTLTRITNDIEGEDATKNGTIIEEFTSYLLPCKFPSCDGKTINAFTISLNNIKYEFYPTDLISVSAGRTYIVNFNISASDESNYFITSFLLWDNGGEYDLDLK